MNDKQKGYLMRLFKSIIIIISGFVIWLLSLIPSSCSIGISLIAIITFILGFMDIVINIITAFSNPDYFKGEVRF